MNTILIMAICLFLIPIECPTIINYPDQGGRLELPVSGATGWAASSLPLHTEPEQSADVILNLVPGQGFTIITEYGEWWNVSISGAKSISGWVQHRSCLINLPDVIPSIIYDITNVHSSVKRSSNYEIPGIIGDALYEAQTFNYHLGRHEFIVPVLYSTSMRLFEAQQAALADGNTLIIYEALRPHITQQRIVNDLRKLMDSNVNVQRSIITQPWSLNWFISTGISNHQRGIAVDVGLGKIIYYEVRMNDTFTYTHITAFERHAMPMEMHELSLLAAVFTSPVPSSFVDAWRTTTVTNNITEGAILLQLYLTDAGFSPLALEWWHFNDLAGVRIANNVGITGGFFTETAYGTIPIFTKKNVHYCNM